MKKFILLLLFSLSIVVEASSQSCFPDGITFTTQSQIDSFQTDYPNCSEIGGFVTISGESITNLNGLNNIVSIGEYLNVESCNSLTSLSGLSNLDTIGGGLSVNNCSILTNVQGLEGINYLTGIELSYNWGLISLEGLNNLDSIDGCLYMQHNGLINFAGLDNLKKIGGCVDITWNGSLVSFLGFENLESIGDYLWIETNDNLSNISSLSNLKSIGGTLYISGTSLTSLDGLDNVAPSSISSMIIYGNGSLSVCGVESICDYLTSPNGVVQIYNNAEGCNSPPEIAHTCGNTMPCLPYGDYFFSTQQMIDNFQTDYPNCSSLSGDVLIMNYYIDSLNGLIPIVSISGDLAIFKTSDLSSLDGLDSLTSVGGNLYIGGYDFWPYYAEPNSHLEDISALMRLKHIGMDLLVKYNPELPSLIGLDSIIFEGNNDIEIGENDILSICNVVSLCDCLSNNCNAEIYSNAAGCNSKEEVEDACLVSVPDFNTKSDFIVYPNPATKSISILIDSKTTLNKVVIYNQIGQEVLNTTEKTDKIDVSKIGQGIFIIELTTNKLNIRKKLLIR